MITPRRTRLVRVPDLHEFRRVLVRLGSAREHAERDAAAVVVPTAGAADCLRATGVAAGVTPVAALLTREQLYADLQGRLPQPPRRLTSFERDAMAQAAATKAAERAGQLPFQIRPGLVAEMLRFYDHLRRQGQTVARAGELLTDAIGADDADRGAARLLDQTRFLIETFSRYEALVRASGACDEHVLRHALVANISPTPLRHLVVSVADWIADAAGFFAVDYDLIARLPHLERIDIVVTEGILASGFHERVHRWLPGLEETDADAVVGASPRVRPKLVRPEGAEPEVLWFTQRDREEELLAVAEQLTPTDLLQCETWERAAVVFKRPLPYIYLAPLTFGALGIPYQASDALPLAIEPVVATVDLVLDALETRFSRTSLVALLSSPHLNLASSAGVGNEAIAGMNRDMSERRFLGELDRLEWLASQVEQEETKRALETSLAVARELAPLLEPAPASRLIGGVVAFLERHFAPLDAADSFAERDQLVRTTLVELLGHLRDAHRAHHDPVWRLEDLAGAVRRWIAEQTFPIVQPGSGVRLADDRAARYGDFDAITIVGLIERDWPEASTRNIFYPPAVLKALGWPSETDRRAADDAHFLDLVASARSAVELSTFTLDDEALVTRSVQLDEVARAALTSITRRGPARVRPGGAAAEWRQLRASRTPADDPRFHGTTGPPPARVWSVSALETYLGCPFKFFAQHVLKLQEEPDDEEVMDPRRQGQFVHEVFEVFFREWQAAGHGSIDASNLDDARRLFTAIVDRALTRLPEGEAALERTRLLGSSAAAGLGEAVFRMEAERPIDVVERLLEHELKGEFDIATSNGVRRIALRGKADRVDLLADGTFRLIDYKLGWAPDRGRALQLPIYALCAEQRLNGRRGRAWTVGEAAYLAFKGPKRVVPLFQNTAAKDEVLARAQQRLADTIDAIERGEFPPTPDDVYRCETCSFAAVCRKDYVGDI